MSAAADVDDQDEYDEDFETENPEVDDLAAATAAVIVNGSGSGKIGQVGDDNASNISSNSIHSNSSSNSGSNSVASYNNDSVKNSNRNSEGNIDDDYDYGLNDNAPGHSSSNNSSADEINVKVTKIQSTFRGARIRKNNNSIKSKRKNFDETKSNNDADSNSFGKVPNVGTGNTTDVAQNAASSITNTNRSGVGGGAGGGNDVATNDNHNDEISTSSLALQGEAVKIQSAYRGAKTRRNIKAVAASGSSNSNSNNNSNYNSSSNNSSNNSSTPTGDSVVINKKNSKVISTKNDRETSTDALTMLDQAVQTDMDREEIRQKESEILRLNTEVLRLNTLLSKSAKLSDELALHKTFVTQKDAEIVRLNEVVENMKVSKSKIEKSNDENNSSMLADRLRASNEEIKDLRLSLERLSKTASGSGSGSAQSSPVASPSKIDVHRAVLNGRDASRDVLAMQLEMLHLENKQLKNEVENLRDRSRLLSNNVKELFAIFSPDSS